MVNVAGVGVGGSRPQQLRTTVFSLSEFIPPAPPATGLNSGSTAVPPQVQLDHLSNLQKEEIGEGPSSSDSSPCGDMQSDKMAARAMLQCRPNSHPFQVATSQF